SPAGDESAAEPVRSSTTGLERPNPVRPARSGTARAATARVARMLVPMVLGLVALGAPALLATPAHADDEDHAITRYHIDAVVDETGSMDVTIDFDVDLGEDPSPGPYLTFNTHQEIENDPDHYRVLEFSTSAPSPPPGPRQR